MRQAFLEAGMVRNTHALKGEVKFEVWLDDGSALRPGLSLFTSPEAGKTVKIASVRRQGDLFLLLFEGICDVDAASALKGRTLYIRREDADPTGERIFFSDLFGLPLVEDGDGTVYGIVKDVTDRGSGYLLLIKLPDGREAYFPMVKEFLVKLDPEKEVRVRAPKGLFS